MTVQETLDALERGELDAQAEDLLAACAALQRGRKWKDARPEAGRREGSSSRVAQWQEAPA